MKKLMNWEHIFYEYKRHPKTPKSIVSEKCKCALKAEKRMKICERKKKHYIQRMDLYLCLRGGRFGKRKVKFIQIVTFRAL